MQPLKLSITGFINSIGCVPEVEEDLRKKILVLSDNSTRVVYDLKGDEVLNICRYCGELFSDCLCYRTEHVFEYLDEAKTYGHCKICKEVFKPNGTGPEAKNLFGKVQHWAINFFSWFSRWVTSISNKHDIGYFEGYSWVRKHIEDNEMLQRTHDKIDRTWYLKPKNFWKKRAELNWLAVDKCGDTSFNFSGCVVNRKT